MDFKNIPRKLLAILSLIVLLLALLPSVYFYQQYKKESEKSKSRSRLAKDEVQSLVKKVAYHIELPKDEEPTIASVSDKEKLKNQPFFARAENGDKVLIYTNAKKAILYRPSVNKIIEVAPVSLGDQTTSTSSADLAKQEAVRVAIYNGTKIAGLASTTEKDLKEKFPFVNVIVKENAVDDYSKTIVVDLKGNKKDIAGQIAKEIGGEISSLPSGEKKPDADILVIVGR